MPFDPFKIHEHHEKVRQLIENDEPGYAQSEIGSTLVSYDATEMPGVMTASPIGPGKGNEEILEEMILDIALDEGIASKQVFAKFRVEWMIRHRRMHPSRWKKKHREAEMLSQLVANRPELFTDQ